MNRSVLNNLLFIVFIGLLCQCNTPAKETAAKPKPRLDALQLKSVKPSSLGIDTMPLYYIRAFATQLPHTRITVICICMPMDTGSSLVEKKGFHGTDNDPRHFKAKWRMILYGWSIPAGSIAGARWCLRHSAWCWALPMQRIRKMDNPSTYVVATPAAILMPNFNTTSILFLRSIWSALIGYANGR